MQMLESETETQRPNIFRRALDGLYLWAGYASGMFLIAIFLLMMALSIGREIGVNIPAGDDFTAWCMAACAFLGLAHTFKSGELIRVGLLIDRFEGPKRRWIELVSLIVAIAFSGFFAWHAIQFTYFSWLIDDRALGVVPVPLWIPQLGYSGGLALLTVAMVDEFVHVLAGNLPRYYVPPPKTAEEAIARAASSAV